MIRQGNYVKPFFPLFPHLVFFSSPLVSVSAHPDVELQIGHFADGLDHIVGDVTYLIRNNER